MKYLLGIQKIILKLIIYLHLVALTDELLQNLTHYSSIIRWQLARVAHAPASVRKL